MKCTCMHNKRIFRYAICKYYPCFCGKIIRNVHNADYLTQGDQKTHLCIVEYRRINREDLPQHRSNAIMIGEDILLHFT